MNLRSVILFMPSALVLVVGCTQPEGTQQEGPKMCTQADFGELFEQRIEPLLAEERPKSCNQCHLSGVDLTLFVRDDACQTMACMTEQGLVDLETPEDSKILEWIARADPDSELITPEVVQAEYDGFLEWIQWSALCGAAACGEVAEPCAGGSMQPACATSESTADRPEFVDPGDCSDLTREAVFREKVFAWRGRCHPCHFQGVEDTPHTAMAPKWVASGACNEASLETMRTVLSRSYIDLENPNESLLLLKPLTEKYGGVEHGGGAKFNGAEDPGYIDFLYWIERESECAAAP